MNDTCRDTIAVLDDYLEHTLAAAQQAVVDGHLRRCPYCRDYFATYRDTVRLSRLAALEPDPADRSDGRDPLGELDELSLRLAEAILRKGSRPS